MATIGPRYDVVILGSGIGGSMLACILAKHGVSTLLVEEQVHPRFTIGESLIPETGIRLRILAEKHGIPEIGWLGSFHALRDNVSAACGVKRAFSFLYHREGQPLRPEESNQLPTLTPPFGPDSHLFRQDTDAYLASMAVTYGATLQQQVKVSQVEQTTDEVRLHTAGGVIRASFLIDAGGMRSHVSTQLALRDETPRFRTDTRTLYTHMIGLKPADQLAGADATGLPSPLSQGTLHHVFDGGWIWVIPFNNHRDATNPLASVGMMLDRRRHPTPTDTPEVEFRRIISRFPSIHKHFEGATAVRPWIASGRLQYSQSRHLAHRILQLPHAACFVDPLYSSGMSVLTVAVDLIADALLPALADGDLAVERFQHIEDVVNAGFDHYDLIVSRSFDAFAHYDLWNAWNRNWVMGNYMGTWGPMALLVRSLQRSDRRLLEATTAPGRIGVLSSHLPDVRAAMYSSAADVDAVTAGQLSPTEAAGRIFERLGALPFLPPYMGFGQATHRAPSTFTLPMGARHVWWYRTSADPKWRDYCDFSLTTYAGLALGFAAEQGRDALRRGGAAIRDIFFANNDEWLRPPKALQAHPQLLPAAAEAEPPLPADGATRPAT